MRTVTPWAVRKSLLIETMRGTSRSAEVEQLSIPAVAGAHVPRRLRTMLGRPVRLKLVLCTDGADSIERCTAKRWHLRRSTPRAEFKQIRDPSLTHVALHA